MVQAAAPAEADQRSVAPIRRVRGTVRVPGDKSISHRAALFNAVADGTARIRNFAPGADCASTLGCLGALGVRIERDGGEVVVHGSGLRGLREPADVVDCVNSGTSMRLLTGLLAGQELFAVLTGDGSLRKRPMARVVEPLTAMGARILGRDGDRLAPLVIAPAGGLHGMEHRPAAASAQVKSSLLLAGLFAEGETAVLEPAATRDHTERMLRAMGANVRTEGLRVSVRPARRLGAVDVDVPGDFSSAAFWLALACLHPDAEIEVQAVGLNPSRTGFLAILQRMGADVRVERARDVAGEPAADLVARSSRLKATNVEGAEVALAIDELPLVALLGLFADGETVVHDAKELKVKESDRIVGMADGLQALGGDVEAMADGWRIRPSRLRFGEADSLGDHRLAMVLALAGALGDGAVVHNAASVAVSYPGFWNDLAAVAA